MSTLTRLLPPSALIAVMLLTLSSALASTTEEAKATPKALTAVEAYQWLSQPGAEPVVLIDVRDPVEIMFTGFTELADIHVPYKIVDNTVFDGRRSLYQAYTNPDFADDVEAALEELGLGLEAHLIFMCRSGFVRSTPAAKELLARGYRNVYSVSDGFEGQMAKEGIHKGARVVNGWKNSGLPWSHHLDERKMYLVLPKY